MRYKINFHFKHNHKTPAYIMCWFGFVLGIMVLTFVVLYKTLPYFSKEHLFTKTILNICFDYLDQFTIQTNILLVVFYGLWLFAYKTKIFKNNFFLTATASYIFLVFIIAWFVMAPIFALHNTVDVNVFEITNHLCVHLITPLIFLIFFIFAASYPKAYLSNQSLPYINSWLWIMIYPLFYFCCLITINFIKLPQHFFNYDTQGSNYMSVYNILTNYNNKCWVPVWNGSSWVVNHEHLQQGQLWRLILVPIVLIMYSIATFILIYLANWRSGVYKKYNNHIKKLVY